MQRTCDRKFQREKERNLNWLLKKQHGITEVQHSVVFNLTEHELSNAEMEVLCRGLKYGIPPKLEREKVLAEFEIGYEQLEKKEVVSEQAAQICKTGLAALAEEYASSKVTETEPDFH